MSFLDRVFRAFGRGEKSVEGMTHVPTMGGQAGRRKITSSDIRLRTVSTSPAFEAAIHVATRRRISCSSLCMSALDELGGGWHASHGV